MNANKRELGKLVHSETLMLIRITLLPATLLLAASISLAQTTFPDQCDGSPLPFAAIEAPHPIDSTCGLPGKPASRAPSQLQNSLKNNFCAPSANPETFTPKMLIDLQANTHVPSGPGHEPGDRAALQQLGEGKVIRMKAFLIEAHHADLGGGESVNCNGPNEEDNDVHIALGDAVDAQECGSVTAEISPHYRPASWNEIGHFEVFNKSARKYVVNVALASRLQAHPYRITGQLFFDSSHQPCPCGTSCAPSRASVWEIHPVYNIEVCKAGASCDQTADGDWMAFDDWWKTLQPIQPVAAPHKHSPHEPSLKRRKKTATPR